MCVSADVKHTYNKIKMKININTKHRGNEKGVECFEVICNVIHMQEKKKWKHKLKQYSVHIVAFDNEIETHNTQIGTSKRASIYEIFQ